MKLLIIGASGVLGSRLFNDAIKKKWNAMGTYCSHECAGLSYLDVRDKNSLEKVFNLFKPEAVVMAGGITDVDLCTLKPKLAEDVNVKGTLNLVKKIKEYGAKLIYISTDYIFDGKNGPYKEDDKPNPVNIYGRTKLEAENIVRTRLKDYLIVRTCQLYGAAEQKPRTSPQASYAVNVVQNSNFAIKIIYNMRNNKKVYAADDLYSTPTYAGSLSEIIIKLIEKKAKGVYHGAGAEFINRYDYVNKIADIFGLDERLIQKVKLKDLELKAVRPSKGGLKVDKLIKEKIAKPYDCETGLIFLKKDMSYA
ncbi:MAG: SDR family oxidoreductase [Candidatus Omnitrophota bacterium]|nr:SDR family oxidoreductase [Candidatus Omnitrophota bacterium]